MTNDKLNNKRPSSLNKRSLAYSDFVDRAIPNCTILITSPALRPKGRIKIGNTPMATAPPLLYLQLCMAPPLHNSLDVF